MGSKPTAYDPMLAIKPWLLITDVGFILYWLASLTLLLDWQLIPADWLFKDYEQALVVSWNWSFFPLDMILSLCGLISIRLHRLGIPAWRNLAAFSLALTFCAGFMALSYWTVRLDFDPMWWAANLFLCAWPLYFLPRLRL